MLGWAFGGILLVGVGIWADHRSMRNMIREEIKIAQLDSGRKRLDSARVAHDSGYRVDTVRLRSAGTAYAPLREAARKTPTDTVAVRKALNAADTAIKACLVVVASCEQRVKDRDAIIRNRDSLVAELRKPPKVPRLSFDAMELYDPFRRESQLRAGAEFRAFWDLRGRVELEHSDTHGFSTRVGIRKVF